MWFKSNPRKYINPAEYTYHSPRYNIDITVPQGEPSDGATGFLIQDLDIEASGVHDVICKTGVDDDSKPITNWMASNIYCDILTKNAAKIKSKPKRWWRKTRAQFRKVGTFLFGGENLKKW